MKGTVTSPSSVYEQERHLPKISIGYGNSDMEVGKMKLSARNMLKAKVVSINHGAVNSEVVMELPCGQQIVSVITKTSAEGLELAEGKDVYSVIKATNVMVGVD